MAIKLWVKSALAHPFVNNATWMLGGSGLQAGIAFISNVILARYLMPEDFGTFAIVQANINLSSAILNLKLEPYIIKLNQTTLKEKYEIITTVAVIQSIINSCIGFLLLMLWGMMNIGGLILLIDKLIAPLVLFQLSIFERKLNYKSISFIETTSNTLSHLLVIVLAISGVGFVVLYIRVFAETILRLTHLIYKKELKKMPLKKVNFSAVKNIISNVRGFWLDALLEGMFERILILGGSFLLTERQLGYFVQAKRLAITPHQLLQPIAFRISYNFFNKVSNLRARFLMLYKILFSEFVVLTVVALIIFFKSESIISFLFGEKWVASAMVLNSMLGVITCLTLFNTYKSFFMSGIHMKVFFKIGRVIQFSILLIALAILYTTLLKVDLLFGVSLTYSLAYVIPVLTLTLYSLLQSVSFKSKVIYQLIPEKK
ncbi:oligosaccharide flippase family protein [Catalinimonas sp. 4WD22]|uniref:oligosaccharide flippase family protein n=1 Tax=Catalinimonas locisalis TaxID=3133978 RepID=UPI0031018BF0